MARDEAIQISVHFSLMRNEPKNQGQDHRTNTHGERFPAVLPIPAAPYPDKFCLFFFPFFYI